MESSFQPLPDDPRFLDPHLEDREFPQASYDVRLALRNNRIHFQALLKSDLGRMEPRGKSVGKPRSAASERVSQ